MTQGEPPPAYISWSKIKMKLQGQLQGQLPGRFYALKWHSNFSKISAIVHGQGFLFFNTYQFCKLGCDGVLGPDPIRRGNSVSSQVIWRPSLTHFLTRSRGETASIEKDGKTLLWDADERICQRTNQLCQNGFSQKRSRRAPMQWW